MTSGDWNAAIEADLLPCPTIWCRRDDKPHTWQDCADEWVVICPSCGVNGPTCAAEAEAITAWNTRQPTTPTTGEDDVERFIPQRARSGGGWYSYDQHRDDSVFWHGERAVVQKDCDQRNAAISPTTEDAELIEELLIAERDMTALETSQKIHMESITGFSADACALLFGTAAKALASIGERS